MKRNEASTFLQYPIAQLLILGRQSGPKRQLGTHRKYAVIRQGVH